MGRGHNSLIFLSILFFLLGSICCFTSPAAGGENTWSSSGPSGARILSLAVDAGNNIVYAGSENVYKTTDGGSNWQSTGLLKNAFIQAILIDPSNADNIYAGTSGGIYKSLDKGGTWSATGLPTSLSVNSLAYDPNTTPDTIYAATDQGVYKSTNGGTSWAFLSFLPRIQVNALALEPSTSDPRTIYAATSTEGIYKSTDGGTTWTAISTDLPSNILSLAIDPTTSSIIYAGTSGKGIYKSSNSGSSWTASTTGLASDATVYSIAVDTSTTSIVYAATSGAGIYKSTNSGGSWTAVNTGLPSSTTTIRALAINTSATSTIYAGTNNYGVYKTTDSGANWAVKTTGIPTQSNISSLVIDPKSPQKLYAAGSITVGTGSSASTIKAIFKSTDAGGTWSTITTTGGIFSYSILSLAINPSTTTTLYAGTLNGGIYKSTDSGSNWSALTQGIFTNTTIYTIAINSTDPNTIYAGGYYVLDSVNIISIIYKSTNGGTTWGSSNTGIPQAGLVYALAIDPKNPTTLYAGTASGVYKSTDGGSTWSPSNSGIDSGDYIYSLAVDPNTTSTIYAGTGNSAKTGGGEVMKSTNSGTTWVATGTQMGSTVINALAIDPNTTSTIYAGTLTGGIYLSQNSGNRWLGINSNLGFAGSVNAIVINPTDTSILHIGTQAGVYSFDFQNRSPNTPSSPSPAHEATVTSALTTLSWSGGDPDPWDTVTYDVYWDGPGNNSNPPLWAANQTSTSIDVSPIQKTSTDYYWKVVAKDNRGGTSTSSIWKFTTGATLTNNSPSTPTNPNPSNGASNQAVNLTLSWTGGDPDNDTVTYKLYFGTSASPSLLASNLSAASYKPSTLIPSTTYYWYIVADDGRSPTTTGPLWSFTTGSSPNNAPNTPSNPSPANGATGQSTDTTLSWTGGDPDNDTVTYDLYFGTDSSNLTSKATGFSTTSYNPGTLKSYTTYYWQVKATDSRGATSLSEVWSFTTLRISGNNAPKASAGADQTVTTGAAITLDGSGSSDPDRDSLTYTWTVISQPAGSNVSISNASNQKATLTPEVDGTYRVQLKVSDGVDSATDIIQIVSLGKDYKIIIATDKENYTSGDTLNFYVWVGNPATGSAIQADAFIGLGLPDGSLLFFNPALQLQGSNIKDSRTFTAFAQNATLSPGLVFPGAQEMTTDLDGNGKKDSFKLYSISMNLLVPKGQYFAFAALAQPGSAQSGLPQIIGKISLAVFQINP